jgi:hypothetical protein
MPGTTGIAFATGTEIQLKSIGLIIEQRSDLFAPIFTDI